LAEVHRGGDMLKTVLVGYGSWGPNVAKNLVKSPHYELTAICDISEVKLERAKSVYGDTVRYFADYKEALGLPGISVVAVALRNQPQQDVARAALSKGIHLFIEKPMATSREDAETLGALAKGNNVLIHVDHLLIYNPFIRRIKHMIDRGELGDIIYFESNRANLGPHIKKDMNVMWDLAVHDIAVLDYLCGGQTPESVKCVGQKKFGNEEIIVYLGIKYNNFVAMIKSSWFSPIKERTLIVSCGKKMVIFDDIKEDEKLAIYDKGIDLTDTAYETDGALEAKLRMGEVSIPNIETEDALLNGLDHFADCIKSGRPSLSNERAAIRVLDILLKADESIKV
jgi:predicted dehydrogenase